MIIRLDVPNAKTCASTAARFRRLSVDEKIDYLQSLWDRIAATPEEIPVPEWHRENLDQRLTDLEADPDLAQGYEPAVYPGTRREVWLGAVGDRFEHVLMLKPKAP